MNKHMNEYYMDEWGGMMGSQWVDGWHNMQISLPLPESVGSASIFKRDKLDEGFNKVSTAYHDRLAQWDFDKYKEACKISGATRPYLLYASLEELDALLTAYYGYPCRIFFVEVQRGYNGYDCVRMDYQYNKPEEEKQEEDSSTSEQKEI